MALSSILENIMTFIKEIMTKVKKSFIILVNLNKLIHDET